VWVPGAPYVAELDDDAWAGIEANGRHRAALWQGRHSGTGYYQNTTARHIAGAAGEWALCAWLDSLGLGYQREYYGWDAVTRRAALEVKVRNGSHFHVWRRQVNGGTVDAMTRRPGPRARAVVWAMYEGDPATRISRVALVEWTTHEYALEAPTLPGTQANRIVPATRVFPLDDLGRYLVRMENER
jgi:hypothetical protein